jgi:ABC-type sugar transport system permease subunit
MVKQSSQGLLVALLAPALVGLLVFRLYPIAIAVISSFYTTVHGSMAFAGLGNYESLIGDHVFWRSLGVTLWFNLLVNPIQIAISLGLALLYVRKFPGASVYRIFFLIPIGVSVPVAVIVWRIMLSQGGFVNGLLDLVGVAPKPWLTSSSLAVYSVVAIATWKGASSRNVRDLARDTS